MRANDRAWLKLKLDTLARTVEDESFPMAFPPNGEQKIMPGIVSAVAQVIRYRCEQLGAFEGSGPTPVLDAVFALDEPRTGAEGALVAFIHPSSAQGVLVELKQVKKD
jgi:ribonucleoside-diphosphate reductase alpha chain